jgi:hypothetical protein
VNILNYRNKKKRRLNNFTRTWWGSCLSFAMKLNHHLGDDGSRAGKKGVASLCENISSANLFCAFKSVSNTPKQIPKLLNSSHLDVTTTLVNIMHRVP